LRAQVRAAMIFNGHTPDNLDQIDEETMAEIIVMYGDGLLGGRGVFDAILPLTQGVFNYMSAPGTPAIKPTQIFPWVIEYDQNPDLEDDLGQTGLLAFLTQAPGFSMERMNGSH
jgi:hypothetical protein